MVVSLGPNFMETKNGAGHWIIIKGKGFYLSAQEAGA